MTLKTDLITFQIVIYNKVTHTCAPTHLSIHTYVYVSCTHVSMCAHMKVVQNEISGLLRFNPYTKVALSYYYLVNIKTNKFVAGQ